MIFMASPISAIARTETNRSVGFDIFGAPVFVIRRIKKLRRFENHFDHVFITVPTGALTSPSAKKEDVHLR